MQITFTVYELALFAIFMLVSAIGVYLFLSFKNFNRMVSQVAQLLDRNKDALNQTIPNLQQISNDLAVIVQDVKNGVQQASHAVAQISDSTAETVLTLSKTADYVSTYAVVIAEVIKTILNFFNQDAKRK